MRDEAIRAVLSEVANDPVEQAGPSASDFVYVDIGSIDRDRKTIAAPQTMLTEAAPSRAKQRLKTGDVLVSMTRPNLNAVAIVSESLDGAIGSTGFHVLRSKWMAPKYLHYLVQSQEFIDAMCAVVQGALYPAVRPSDIAAFEMRVPPHAEQTRIVDKLEELLSDLDAGVAELKAAQKKLAQYRRSLLNAAVTGSLTDSGSSYPKVLLGEIVTSLGQGWSPRCEREPATSNDDWAVIKTTAIQPLSFDGRHNKRLPTALRPREHLELRPGDLLVTRAGPRARVGITCLVRETRRRLLLCDKAYRIECNCELIDPAFLELVLNAPAFVNQIDSLKTGINDSGLNLTQERFFALSIPLPPLAEQQAVIRGVESQIRDSDEQHAVVERALRQSTAQRKNILQAAFSGQIVPQDPNDEPASVLLARIRAERAAVAAIGTRRGRRVGTAL